MRVKVHPHRTRYQSEREDHSRLCVSVTPDKKGGRAYYMATVMLTDVEFRVDVSGVAELERTGVRNVHAWLVGNLTEEYPLQFQPTEKVMRYLTKVRYDFKSGRFLTFEGVDVTDKKFPAACIVGRDLYVGTQTKFYRAKREEAPNPLKKMSKKYLPKEA